jgi:hypothetical protein
MEAREVVNLSMNSSTSARRYRISVPSFTPQILGERRVV